ncbi:MAG: hypothetical protein SOY69_08450 [Alloprevotella sp.]|nr:hypothetical protein [Alloprevotella sp.]
MSTTTAAAQKQTAKDSNWSYPTEKPANPFDGGDGTESNPYRIRTAQQLMNLAWMVNDGEEYEGKYFLMTDDIVLNEGVIREDGSFNTKGSFKDCIGIGHYNAIADDDFCGIFDGGGHTIYGFYRNILQNETEHYTAALFYSLDNAIVQNLNISHSLIENYQPNIADGTGYIAGSAYKSTIANCHITKSIIESRGEGTGYFNSRCFSVGGIAGLIEKSTVKGCSFSGHMYVRPSRVIKDSYVYLGGIVGSMKDKHDNTITNCVSEGSINYLSKQTVTGVNIGGIAGFANKGFRISGCCSKMTLLSEESDGTDLAMGGILGQLKSDGYNHYIERCVNLGELIWGQNGVGHKTNKIKLIGGIGTLYSYSLTSNGDLWVTDCANYGSIHVRYDVSIFNEKNTEEALDNYTLTAGCMAMRGMFGSKTRSYFTRCISVTPNNDMDTDAGLKIRFAPIMGYLDRQSSDEPDIQTIDRCYYYSDASKCRIYQPTHLNKGLYAPIACSDMSAFLRTQPWTATPEEPWLPLAASESKTWAGYTVPVLNVLNVEKLFGGGTASDPFLIYTENDLANLSQFLESNLDANFRLMNDLYMANQPAVTRIKEELNYQGTFDGNGHCIDGLRVTGTALFEKLSGTVKNLTLTNFRGNETANKNTSIAGYHYGTIENCAVYGTISARLRDPYAGTTDVTASGIARTVFEGGVIRGCMFKGTLKTSPKTSGGETNQSKGAKTTSSVSGIANIVRGTIEKCGTIENCYASFDLHVEDGFDEPSSNKGISQTFEKGAIKNCAYVCADAQTMGNSGVTKCTSEAAITPAMLGDTDGATWLQGAYGPVNKHTKYFTVTDPDGNTTYLDCCYDASWTYNKVYNLTLTEANANDAMLMRFRNLALYNQQTKTSYIIGLMLDRDKEKFDYTPAEGCTATKGATTITLKAADALAGTPGHYLLCLPCPLRTADLPEGSMLHSLNYLPNNESMQYESVFNLTECDSVAAGVPCHVYIPACKDGNYTLTSYGDIVTAPQGTGTYGPQGYFTKQTIRNAYTGIKLDEDVPNALTYSTDDTTMKIFGAAAKSEKHNTEQYLSTRRIIDENDPYLAETIKSLNGQTKNNLYLKRKLWGKEWNTLTLPFDIEVKTLAGYGGGNVSMQAQELQSVSTDANGALTLTFADVTELKAGYPYLVKPTTDCETFDLSNAWLDIKAEANIVTQSDGTNEVSMIPYYVPRVLVAGDYFLMGDKFYVVAEGMNVPSLGMRARFTANAAASEALQSARLVFDNGDVTGIDGITRPAATTNGAVYDLSGRRVEKPAHGLYIVNGRKVLLP